MADASRRRPPPRSVSVQHTSHQLVSSPNTRAFKDVNLTVARVRVHFKIKNVGCDFSEASEHHFPPREHFNFRSFSAILRPTHAALKMHSTASRTRLSADQRILCVLPVRSQQHHMGDQKFLSTSSLDSVGGSHPHQVLLRTRFHAAVCCLRSRSTRVVRCPNACCALWWCGGQMFLNKFRNKSPNDPHYWAYYERVIFKPEK